MKIDSQQVVPKFFKGTSGFPLDYHDWFSIEFKHYYIFPLPIILPNNQLTTVHKFCIDNGLNSTIKTVSNLIKEVERVWKKNFEEFFSVVTGSSIKLAELEFIFNHFDRNNPLYYSYDILRLVSINKEKIVHINQEMYRDEVTLKADNFIQLYELVINNFSGLCPESIISQKKDFGFICLYGAGVTESLVGTNLSIDDKNCFELRKNDVIWDYFDL